MDVAAGYSSRGTRRPLTRELWQYRDLLRSLVARNLKVKYQRSTLGFAWTLLNPIAMVGVLVLVFSYIVRIPVPHYWAFLVSGYFAWSFILQMLNTSTYVIAEHGRLRRSVAFPTEMLIFGAAGSRFVEFAIELTLVLAALTLLHHEGVPPSFVLLPVLLVILVLLAMGIAFPIATLSVFYQDVQHALPVALLTLFYVSPVFYPAELVPEQIRALYFLNPIAGVLTLFHTVLYEGRFPPTPLLAGVGAFALFMFGLGYAIFNRYKSVFAEIV